MDRKLDEPDTAGFRVVEKDPQWTHDYKYHLNNENGKGVHNYLKIANEAVSCTGSRESPETHFKVYFHYQSDVRYALFECIGGKSENWMLCVNSQNQLSARKKKKNKEYINFEDAEEDVLFSIVPDKASEKFHIKWKKGDQYIVFDKKGQPQPLDKVIGNGTLFTTVLVQ